MGDIGLFLVKEPETLTTHCGAAVRDQGHHGPPGDDLGAPLPKVSNFYQSSSTCLSANGCFFLPMVFFG
jgi:hypothetical protein